LRRRRRLRASRGDQRQIGATDETRVAVRGGGAVTQQQDGFSVCARHEDLRSVIGAGEEKKCERRRVAAARNKIVGGATLRRLLWFEGLVVMRQPLF
jgi:hypothetical protein